MQSTESKKYYLFRNGGIVLLSVIFLLCVFIRIYRLNDRPMHVDEAVHAVKFGNLLEHNYYRYDPVEYHGPTLNYLTLIPAWIFGESKLADVNEATLRIIPVLCGLLLLAFLFLLKPFGNELLFSAIIFTGFSSLIIFYNRYYIQESLLVSFSFCAIIMAYQFYRSRKNIFLAVSAFLFALSFASKETNIITVLALLVPIVILRLPGSAKSFNSVLTWKQVLLFITVFIVTAVFLFTSFLSNPNGALDSINTFVNYFSKAGNNQEHVQPFYYYFSLISFRTIDGFFFSELVIVIFFLFGFARSLLKVNSAMVGIGFIKFLALFTLILIFIYSALPYKTPWTMMSFWQGMILIAAFGFAELKKFFSKTLWNIFLLLIGIFMFIQSYYTSVIYSSNPENPFVYSHAGKDVKEIKNLLVKVAEVQPENMNTPIYIAASKSDYWPLPWYLRKFPVTSWNEHITDDVYKFPIIISTPEFESELINKLYSLPPIGSINLYLPLFEKYMELRPQKEIRGYIRKDYLDNFNNLTQSN